MNESIFPAAPAGTLPLPGIAPAAETLPAPGIGTDALLLTGAPPVMVFAVLAEVGESPPASCRNTELTDFPAIPDHTNTPPPPASNSYPCTSGKQPPRRLVEGVA